MAEIEYGVYSDVVKTWLCNRDDIIFHTDCLGVAIAQRDMCNDGGSAFSGIECRVRQFPVICTFDSVENIRTMGSEAG